MNRRTARVALLAGLGVLVLSLSGCGALRLGPTGPLSLHLAHAPERRLPTAFDSGFYSFAGPDDVTIVLYQGTLEEPEQAMTIHLFAEPRPGRTPLVREATNAVVRYIRFETAPTGERHVSVYSGAGFVRPSTRPGRPTMRAGVREATLRLLDTSTALPELPPEALLAGRFTVERDDVAARRALRQLEIVVSDTLSYPRLVRAGQD